MYLTDNKSEKYFYDVKTMSVFRNPLADTIQPDWVEIKEGYVLTNGKVVVDDRGKSLFKMYMDGSFDPYKNASLTNVVSNPLIFL